MNHDVNITIFSFNYMGKDIFTIVGLNQNQIISFGVSCIMQSSDLEICLTVYLINS